MITRRSTRLMIVLLIVITACLIWLTRGETPPGEAAGTGTPAIGGAFALTDQNGNAVTDANFRGKLMLVFFGFTHCPDICPAALGTLTDVMNKLQANATKVTPIFITVDPERDTPARMKEYIAPFHPTIVGLSGDKQATEQVEQAYKVYAAKRAAEGEPAGEGYMMDHSGFIYLMGTDGQYLAHFTPEDDADEITAAVQRNLP